MTLDRHRSKLIPDVLYSGDGTIFVTDREGTFPLRHGKNEKHDVRDVEYGADYDSFRSFDPKRDKERKYKQRNSASRYGQEVQTLSGTVSTQSSHSLARKLRRSKSFNRKQDDPLQKYGTYSGSVGGSTGRGRRLRGEPPKITPEFAASLREKRERAEARKRSLDLSNISPYMSNGSLNKKKSGSRDSKDFLTAIPNGSSKSSLMDDPMFHHRKIHAETLPFIIFLVDAMMLLCAGIARVVLVYWHEYFAPLWTALLLLILGIIGSRHKAQYLSPGKSTAYVWFAFLSAIATMAGAALVLKVLIPFMYLLILDVRPEDVATQVEFSNWGNKTLTGIELDGKLVTWVELALDISTLMFLLVGFFSLTAAMMGFGNYWDASYDTTGECDHRGNPRYFNPIEQMVVGQASTFVGVVVVVLVDYLDKDLAFHHYYSPVWAGIVVIIAGFASTCFGKRPDRTCWGMNSVILELLALAACSGAVVLLTLSMVDSVRKLVSDGVVLEPAVRRDLIICSVAQGVYILMTLICLIFLCGVLFRVLQRTCCRCCQVEEFSEDRKNNNNSEWRGH